MDKIIILVFLGTILLLLNKEPKELFIQVFLPVLLVMPMYYDTKIVPGIPEMSFWSAVLLPIAFVWLFNKHGEGYRFSLLDILVLVHLSLVFAGQWHVSTYKEAQKIFYNDLTSRLLPLVMARAWFMDPESRIKMFRVLIIASAVVGFFLMYEFRFWYNVFDYPLRKIWPHSVPWGSAMKRGGLKRAFGPFGHPICAGYYFTMIVPLAVWMWKNNYFTPRWKGLLLTLLCVGGGIASISRAPNIGIFLGFVIVWYGWCKSKTIPTMIVASLLAVASVFVIPKFLNYISVTRATAETEDQRNAAYRRELLENYQEVIAEKPLLGWGRFTVPSVKGLDSMDNEYLAIAVASGKLSLYAYLAGIVWIFTRLFFFAARGDPTRQETRLAWCFLASILTALFTQATVYAGTQTVQFFYIFFGFSEGLLQSGASWNEDSLINQTRYIGDSSHGYRFTRTI